MILVVAFIAFGCAGPINQKTASNYEQLAQQAKAAGNLALAEEYYSRALWNADMGNASLSDRSRLTYNLGRVKGLRCDYAGAEALLSQALQLEEGASGPDSGLTSMRLFELARLNAAWGRPDEARLYYARAVPIVGNLDIETSDPIGFADVLDDYAAVLEASGDTEAAATTRQDAERLRRAHPQMRAGFVKEPYNSHCEPPQ